MMFYLNFEFIFILFQLKYNFFHANLVQNMRPVEQFLVDPRAALYLRRKFQIIFLSSAKHVLLFLPRPISAYLKTGGGGHIS